MPDTILSISNAAAPINYIGTDDLGKKPKNGIALCLSGGGYRAMLFHVGVIWRLYDSEVLFKLSRVSSVSGGSITAAVLGMNWDELDAAPRDVTNFKNLIVDPIKTLANKTIDRGAIIGGILLPGSVSDRIVKAYKKHVFGDKTLQDLTNKVSIVINATNLQSGALWRFSKPYMADWRVGMVKNPTVSLAKAVGASSAFPPFLSPCELELTSSKFVPNSGADLQKYPYTSSSILSDGGVYDNLGLETAYKNYDTLLVSDAGGKMADDPNVHKDWARQSYRVLNVIDNQVRSLRKRQLIAAYIAKERFGAFWGVRTNIDDYGLGNSLPCPHNRTMELAETATRLKKLSDRRQERLINWGYAVCDAAIRTHYDQSISVPTGFPYDDIGV